MSLIAFLIKSKDFTLNLKILVENASHEHCLGYEMNKYNENSLQVLTVTQHHQSSTYAILPV